MVATECPELVEGLREYLEEKPSRPRDDSLVWVGQAIKHSLSLLEPSMDVL